MDNHVFEVVISIIGGLLTIVCGFLSFYFKEAKEQQKDLAEAIANISKENGAQQKELSKAINELAKEVQALHEEDKVKAVDYDGKFQAINKEIDYIKGSLKKLKDERD